MPDEIEVMVDGKAVRVSSGAMVAVAISLAGAVCRRSVSGEMRGPLCGMGTCFECRATVNGIPFCRTCQILCLPGMQVNTDG
jgi:D-hydroxyproline dehydrogenase subunit gamma